jgi:hypothetical protein
MAFNRLSAIATENVVHIIDHSEQTIVMEIRSILVIEDLTVSKHCESILIVILHIFKEEVMNRCRRANV